MQEFAEEMHLSHVVLPVLLSLMKQDMKHGGPHLRTAWLLLLAMMLKKGPLSKAIAAAFLDAGGVTVTLAALGQHKEAAVEQGCSLTTL
ncbi:TPA: hypothetical protein ACH3X1_003652 [Trebouxia sp. C0004]